jgi:NAD(P)-dependent dehydrogenase (short-subunit alcohol dehydrogenase family)
MICQLLHLKNSIIQNMLQNKTVVIYGASPSLGGAVAKEMARAGAKVFVSNRHIEKAKDVALQINSEGGTAEADEVDVLNPTSVQQYLDSILKKTGRIDISFNLAGFEVLQDVPLIEMSVDDFVQPIGIAMQGNFITATAAGKIMSKQGTGVILSLTATPGGIGYPGVGGFGPACAAIETLSINLAAELGPSGVRVVNIRSAGSPDSRPFKQAVEADTAGMNEVFNRIKSDTMLKEMPLMKDIANTAVFLASDMARMITGTTVDVTAGTTTSLVIKPTLKT